MVTIAAVMHARATLRIEFIYPPPRRTHVLRCLIAESSALYRARMRPTRGCAYRVEFRKSAGKTSESTRPIWEHGWKRGRAIKTEGGKNNPPCVKKKLIVRVAASASPSSLNDEVNQGMRCESSNVSMATAFGPDTTAAGAP